MRAVIDTIKLDRLTASASEPAAKQHWEGFSALSEGSEPIVGQGEQLRGLMTMAADKTKNVFIITGTPGMVRCLILCVYCAIYCAAAAVYAFLTQTAFVLHASTALSCMSLALDACMRETTKTAMRLMGTLCVTIRLCVHPVVIDVCQVMCNAGYAA